LSAKQGATPAVAITTPASAGPSVRAPLMSALPRLTAFTSRSGPTSSTRNACRAGLSTAFTAPRAQISASSIHSSIAPVVVSASNASAGSAIAVCVISSNRRLSKRSAITPPHAPTISIGANCSAAATPTATPLCVSCSTSHISATVCIHVPLSETS
jgi:hypothetical protein